MKENIEARWIRSPDRQPRLALSAGTGTQDAGSHAVAPSTRPQSNLFAGEPLEVHYRGGFVIGVAFPLRLKDAFASREAK